MARFMMATMSIPDLHPAVTRHAVLIGLKLNTFMDSLYSDPPPNMDNLRAQASRDMSIEENAYAKKGNSQPQVTEESSRHQKSQTRQV